MAYEASEIPRRRFVCRFIPRREQASRRATTLLTRDAREALGAFVHLDVPDHEPGRILVTDEAGVVLLSASWPPGRELEAEGGATASGDPPTPAAAPARAYRLAVEVTAVSLAEEYGRQLPWREWPRVLDALPPLEGRLVLDLGCAIGDQAAALAARGARVVGVDVNEELLAVARGRSIPRADFRQHDLRALPDLGLVADGIWCSLTPAFFPDLPAALRSWARHLRPGGFAALVEIDDLWGHEPLGAPTRRILDAYAAEALAAGRYDMHMGRKLRRHLEAAGFTVTASFALEDRELSFAGPARPDVIEAWRLRLERLKPLRELCGDRFEAVRADFLACLARLDHRCTASVQCCVAVR